MAEILKLSGGLSDLAPSAAAAMETLEGGGLLVLPDLPFSLSPQEAELADPAVLALRSKNVSLDPATGRVSGHVLEEDRGRTLEAMMRRYAAFADTVLETLLPAYVGAARRRRTSFRPGAIDTRALSPRKDDKRLHVDAFPSSPVGGDRILRVFSNVDPLGRDRVWRVGDAGFEAFSTEFRARLKGKSNLELGLLQRLGITRGRRSAYDQAMLELHDAAKLDEAWQASAPRTQIALPAGSSWIVYTDGVLHAAMSGCNAFEQTYQMPAAAMQDPSRAPVRALERLLERRLV